MRRTLVGIAVALIALIPEGAARTSYLGPRRELNAEDRLALTIQYPTIVLARIANAVDTMVSAGRMRDGFVSSNYLLLEPLSVLKGESLPARFKAGFGSHVGGSPNQARLQELRGRTAIIALTCLSNGCRVMHNPFLVGFGIVPVRDALDPEVTRFSNAIRRMELDSLAGRAEVICVGDGPRGKSRLDTLIVRDWISGPRKSEAIEVFWPFGRGPFQSRVLVFLARNPLGKLEPLDMGAGQFEIENGRVTRLNRSLDEIVRLVRMYRLVHEARQLDRERKTRNPRRVLPPH